jgi:hypothetical protein
LERKSWIRRSAFAVTLATSLDIQTATVGPNGTFTLSGDPTVRIFGAGGTTSGFALSGLVSITGSGTITFENVTSSDSYVRSFGALSTAHPAARSADDCPIETLFIKVRASPELLTRQSKEFEPAGFGK